MDAPAPIEPPSPELAGEPRSDPAKWALNVTPETEANELAGVKT